ncbi:hypothetical protein PIB30_090997 [Stylosanthes scabra]|uniref:F-box domain-containing protein n=1 Tax=Stylosanthes scabra TaxID=79078 RepID=A0ABU6TV13_9FABA|nr:hypothetical protein [Stylosanthes scabra]
MKADGGERCNLPVLPDDIVPEILVRLPMKALLQFKCVCKSWRTRISSPQFAMDNFHQRSSVDRRLPSRLVYENNDYYNYRFGFLPLQPLFMNPSATTSVVSYEMGYNMGLLVIRGPLHPIRIPMSVTVHGQNVTRIYTFGANSCSFGLNFPYPAVGFSGYIGKFLSGTGTLNWMAKVNDKNWVILSLDLANETFRQVSLPTLYGGGYNSCDPELQILRNCLSFTIDHRDIIFDVWMMKDYGVWESWTLISRVNLWRHSCSYPLTPLSISEHDVLLLMIPPDGRLVLFKADVDLFCYPQIDSSSDALPICPKGILRRYFVHHDSLVLPPQ